MIVDDYVGVAHFDNKKNIPSRQLGRLTGQVSFERLGNIYAVDPAELRAGDVVLFKTEGGFVHDRIVDYQRALLGRAPGPGRADLPGGSHLMAAADCVHVGILDVNLNVWDATDDDDILQSPLREVFCCGSEVAVVRMRRQQVPANFEARLTTALLRFSNAEYSKSHFVMPLIERLFPKLREIRWGLKNLITLLNPAEKQEYDRHHQVFERFICSVFVTEVLNFAVGNPGVLDRQGTPVPMDFVLGEFDQVPLRPIRPQLERPAPAIFVP